MPGIVASGHPETSRAAAEILAEGGNAFDAALAGLLMASVSEPLLTSLAGGGFLLAAPADEDPMVFDFFAETPAQKNPDAEFFPIQGDFGTATQEFHIGLGACAVPGVPRGLWLIHRKLGSMPLMEIARPALEAAVNGIDLNEFQAYTMRILEPIISATPGVQQRFSDQEGLLRPGQTITNPELAQSIEQLCREGSRDFYQGETGQALLQLCRDHGGHLTAKDLAGYDVEMRLPMESTFHGHRIYGNPIPSVGGALIALSLSLLERVSVDQPADLAMALTSVFEQTQMERHRTRLQHEPTRDKVEEMVDPGNLRRLLRQLDRRQLSIRGTTHISVADGRGNLAALSSSNGEGCGRMLPGTGIHLNNFLGEEDLSPDGVGQWVPGHRLSSMMSPTVVQRDDGRRIALGSGGSNRIRSALSCVLVNLLARGKGLEQSVRARRLHLENAKVSVEPGWPDAVLTRIGQQWELERWDQQNLFFGGVHAVSTGSATHPAEAVGDLRRGGHALTVE
ncbi:MAG: gamma-glutamyltransferase [Xanthomonadales bacterium]|nr:gamma-glutamyltransferase [Xanthomonadales bacterium]